MLDVIPLALPEYADGFFPRLYTSLVSAAARGSTQVIAISDAAKAEIAERLAIPPDRITTTHLAVDEQYHPRIGAERDPAVREKYNLPEQYVLAGFGFDRRKRLDVAMRAFSYVAKAEGENTTLVIAGREPHYAEPMFPDLRALARELEIEPFVQWIGYVDEADKPSLLRMASVFVFPSEYEGFGLPVLEAMACGTPVIASDIPVIQEVVEDAAYLVTSGDVRKMGGAMLALLLQDPLRQQMITRGLGRATRYSWRKTALETLAVYERTLAGARQR
ncbi:MAG: glycosyltransferase family 4 protein [Chloroflexi bacterium]|nr:glycosyltransferase family 4 protein [Chloroflexota bacterium]